MAATRTTVRGCCPLDCQDTCSWVAHVEAGRVVRVEGQRDHPFTRGALCAKVNDYQARTYSDERVLQPLRRCGAKGAGEFEPISWDAALDQIAERFAAIVERHGGEALAPAHYLGSMGVVQRRALMRVLHALGGSSQHGSICGAAAIPIEVEGHPRAFDPEELVDSRFILIWGANILTTCHHHWHFIQEARTRHGARVVCIDPIRTRTARAADEHISLVPGSDAALAAGLAHVMFRDGLADLDFASRVASDLDALRALVAPWTPERVETVCEVPAATVVRIAREFAAARPGVIRQGVGLQQSVHGDAICRLLSALAILSGHWQLRGGGLFGDASPLMDGLAVEKSDALRPGPGRSLDIARLGEHLTSTELEPRVHGLMVWGTNPVVTQPDADVVRRGLAREDLFCVVVEHMLTDTARFADIVLPSTTQLEHFDLVGAWGHHYISLNEQAVAPRGEARTHGEIMRGLAARLGLDHPALYEDDEQIAAAALPEGVSIADLRAARWTKHGPPRPSFDETMPPLRLAEAVPVPPAPPAPDLLRLLTPKSHYFLNSSFANMPRQRRSMRRPTVDVHPDDAARSGVVDGQAVELRNARGTIRAHVRTTDDVHPGTVALAGKWWQEPDGANANLLTPSAWSPGGQPAYNDGFVQLAGIAT